MAQAHQDLKVWQRAMEMAVQVYTLTKDFPKEEIAWTITHLPEISDETSSEHIVLDTQKMSYRYVA